MVCLVCVHVVWLLHFVCWIIEYLCLTDCQGMFCSRYLVGGVIIFVSIYAEITARHMLRKLSIHMRNTELLVTLQE